MSTVDQSGARQERELVAFEARAGYDVIGIFKETASGGRTARAEHRQVMAPTQRRESDAMIVSELSRWGCTMLDLLHSSPELQASRASMIAMNGPAFDLAISHGRAVATVLAGAAAPRTPREY